MPERAEDTIRILIVDDIAETRENIRKLLQFEVDIEIVGGARTGLEGVQLAKETKPDVVLMDINMPDMDGITATEAILTDTPFAQIVILSVQNDADYMRRAMLAGARDFIAKPPSGDELVSTIRLVAKRAREQRAKMYVPQVQPFIDGPGAGLRAAAQPQGKVLAIYSAKGGVGCTTLATNMAIGLNSDSRPTVLVDSCLQFGDASVFLNLQVKNSIVDLASRSEELDRQIIDDVLISHDSGIKVLAAPPRPEMADEIRADQVRRVLQALKRQFSYVVVDTSSTMDDITLAVLDAATVLMIIATPDIPSIKDARLVFDLLDVLEFPTERVFFLINKMDRKAGITTEAIAENLKRPVDGSLPEDERLISLSINRGIPILMGDRSKLPAKAFVDLLGQIRSRMDESAPDEDEVEAAVPARSGLVRR